MQSLFSVPLFITEKHAASLTRGTSNICWISDLAHTDGKVNPTTQNWSINTQNKNQYLLQRKYHCKAGKQDHGKKTISKDTCHTTK